MHEKCVLCVWTAAATKTTMPTEHLTRKALECALQTWFGNNRDEGAGRRKLALKENTVLEDRNNSGNQTESAGQQCD